MFKNLILCFTLIAATLTLSSPNLFAQGNNSPFLITGELPHLTKILMKQWDNPALHLTEDQKTKLLVIRKETITGVRTLSPQVTVLQQQVTEGINNGKTPEELQATVEEIAALKAKATMLHLHCIYKTKTIISQEQLEILLQQ